MSKIPDEILNEYLDNELDGASIDKLKKDLNDDEESLKNLKLLKTVDSSLKKLEVYPAPENFTEKVMNVIGAGARKVKQQTSYFFISIMSIFTLAIVGIFVFVFDSFDLVGGSSPGKEYQMVETAKKFVSENVNSFGTFFSGDKMLLVGGVLTIILFLTGFFVYDSHKSFKNKLKGITQ